MNGAERREARYRRRKAERDAKKEAALAEFDNFERIANIDNLYAAFKASKRSVEWKESVRRYEANALRNVIETRKKLLSGESVQAGFHEFTLRERGKVRHIKLVHISERIVQKCLCDRVLVPILSKPLIYDNGASVRGKGTHFALRRLIRHLSRYYRLHDTNKGYALIIDFKKFFDNIDHETLFRLIDKRIKDKRIRNLIRRFVSVFGPEKSLGLGSQISQIAAIYYPDTLDHFIKEKLRIKYYGRYMDDLYIIHSDISYLRYCFDEIKKVCAALKIMINENKSRIVKLKDGVPFLKGKYALLENGKILRLPSKDSTARMKRKLKKFNTLLDKKLMSSHDVHAAYRSWRGNYKRRFNAYHRLRYMDILYNDLFIHERHNGGKHERVSGKKKRRGSLSYRPEGDEGN